MTDDELKLQIVDASCWLGFSQMESRLAEAHEAVMVVGVKMANAMSEKAALEKSLAALEASKGAQRMLSWR